MNGSKKLSEFNEYFIKNYNEESDEEYFLEVDVQYSENLHHLNNDLPFLPETMKIEKFEKLVANICDKTEFIIHIEILKHALNHELVLKKVQVKFKKFKFKK